MTTMEQFYETVNKKKWFRMAIDKIDGIVVNCQLNAFDGGRIVLTIFKGQKPGVVELYTDVARSLEAFTIMINKMSELKYDNKVGMFYVEQKKEDYEQLYTFPNIELDYVECSVCFEITKTKTSCNHPLCYKCYDKIPNKCPICRKDIKNEDDSEDDE